MPFKSDKQRKWMHVNEPEMAKKWEKEEKNEGNIGITTKKGKSIELTHRKSGKEIVVQNTPSVLKKYAKMGYLISMPEGKKRDYKAEYKKYGSSKKSKKYRAELNKYNRQKGTYGNGDKKDASHKGGKIVGFEEQSKNRGRREKSRLKKEIREAWETNIKDFGKKTKVKIKPHRGTMGAYFAKPVKPEISKLIVPFFKKKGYKLTHKSLNVKGSDIFIFKGHDGKECRISVNDDFGSGGKIVGKNLNFSLLEQKITEGFKKIAKKNVKYKDKYGTWNWSIESGIDTDVMGGNTPKIILFYQHKDKEGYPESGGNTFWLKHKNGKPYTPQEAKKYRAELNAYNRKKGTYGNGDGKDASHKGGKIVGFEAESKNRGRAEKSRLKKEEKLDEFNKAHFLNLVKQELKSKEGQLAYAHDKISYSMTPKWERKEWLEVAKDLKKEIKVLEISVKQIMKMKEEKLSEGMSRSQAQELLNQLGGNRFKAMVGAKDFGIGSDGLHFKIGRNSKSISHIAIRLTSMDVYEMKFLRVRAGNVKVVKKVNNVYADQLGVIFKKYTGMNVRL